MAFYGKELSELKHKINNPLAAIRNALYLTALRVRDPEAKRYLKLANEEVSRIAMALNNAEAAENEAFIGGDSGKGVSGLRVQKAA